MSAIFNAANEVAVEAFIAQKIGFTSILPLVQEVVEACQGYATSILRDLADVSGIEENARARAHELLIRLAP
jgi:1-deoxy-D-xylulose-5-phosphate reductoisomerase